MVGQSVAHYRIVDCLGSGGMGVVYKAEDLRLGRVVALKFLSPELSSSPLAVERFMREARTASSLNHPNICTIYSIEESEGQRFLAMELLEGRPLNEVIAGTPMATDTVIDLGLQIADALDAAHSQGVLHRDIKPANIFVTRRGLVKVLDFGLAKLTLLAGHADAHDSNPTVAEVMLTTQGMALGTVVYMSPEQARGESLDARSDIFSFGIVLYEMVTGQQAFAGRTSAVVFDAILNREPPPPHLHAEVPEPLELLILQALDKDPVARFQNMAELRSELASLKRERQSGQFLAASSARLAVVEAGPDLSEDDTPTQLVRRPRSSAPPPAPSASSVVPEGDSGTGLPALAPTVTTGEPLAVSSLSQPHVTEAAPVTVAVSTVAPVPSGPATLVTPLAPPPAPARRSGRTSRLGLPVLAATGLVVVLCAGAAVYWFGRARHQVPPAGGEPAAALPTAESGPAAAPLLPTNASAEATMALAGSTAAPGDVPGVAVPARPGKKAPTPRPTPGPAAAPAPAPTLSGGAIIPALPRASAQRVDPGALLLTAARTKYDAKLLDEARTDLQTLLRDHATSGAAPGAWLLSAKIDGQQGRLDDAIASLMRLRTQYHDDAVNAEGAVLLGQLLERSKRPDRVALAREVLADVPQRFADSPWAPRALAQRALLETRERVKATDPSLGSVPAAFLTSRLLIERYPAAVEAEFAFWQVAEEYEDRKAYDRAAATLVDMTTRFPQTRLDAWWRLAEIYDKRLKDAAAARSAYLKVPPSSARYKDAQKRAERR